MYYKAIASSYTRTPKPAEAPSAVSAASKFCENASRPRIRGGGGGCRWALDYYKSKKVHIYCYYGFSAQNAIPIMIFWGPHSKVVVYADPLGKVTPGFHQGFYI